MNPYTQRLWELLLEQPLLLEQLTAIMRRSYEPFLSQERAFRVNACAIEQHLRDEFDLWYEWLPETPINALAGQCALALLDVVDWNTLARLVIQYEENASLLQTLDRLHIGVAPVHPPVRQEETERRDAETEIV
ncbi:MAG TPA: hypothetical protein VFA41_21360 [Ktedonobacteraceae bacterium]|jgi:hypothetical protein|nr:hypothetical protein [Ktedonobacteraceae bacterium]